MYSESCCSKEIKNSLFVGFFLGHCCFWGFLFWVICRGRILFILLENFFRNRRQGMKQASKQATFPIDVVVGIDSIQHNMMSVGIDWSDAKQAPWFVCKLWALFMHNGMSPAECLLVQTFLFYLHVRLAEEWWPKKFNVDMVFLQDNGIFQKVTDTDTVCLFFVSV